MKKILYSILAISTMFFATSCREDMNDNRGTTTEVVDANNKEDVDPEHIREYDATPGASATTGETDADEQYRTNADEITTQVAADLKLNTDTKARVRDVYYNRNKRLGDLSGASAANASSSNTSGSDVGTGGSNTADAPIEPNTVDTLRADANAQANSSTGISATDPAAARKRINEESERQLQTILTPEQWKTYQQNRTKYDAIK